MNLIALVDINWGIARDGRQICTIPADLRRFRDLTMGGTVLMGRKTYQAIGHALPGRRNIVFSRGVWVQDAEVYSDIDDFMKDCGKDQFVVGGESIYRQLLPYCDRAYITLVYADLGADQFIDDLFESNQWKLVNISGIMHYDEMAYQFLEYCRTCQLSKLDRSRWVGCELCSATWSKKDWCEGGAHDFRIDGNELLYYDEKFGWEGITIKFCPNCGRPLTEEAWAELEQRIGGNDGTTDI